MENRRKLQKEGWGGEAREGGLERGRGLAAVA